MFEEISFHETKLGELVLRRRTEPRLNDVLVYEVKLGDEFLMSSLFTVGERALATLALARREAMQNLNVVVGGLGLGYTAAEALKDDRVQSLIVIEALGPVIEWHRSGLVPLGNALAGDKRCRLINGDFFALSQNRERGFDHDAPGRAFDAILLDIDHSTKHWLAPGYQSFYAPSGMTTLAEHLVPGGVFAMWSDDGPDADFVRTLESTFVDVSAEVVEFYNPDLDDTASCTIYLAQKRSEK